MSSVFLQSGQIILKTEDRPGPGHDMVELSTITGLSYASTLVSGPIITSQAGTSFHTLRNSYINVCTPIMHTGMCKSLGTPSPVVLIKLKFFTSLFIEIQTENTTILLEEDQVATIPHPAVHLVVVPLRTTRRWMKNRVNTH